MLPLYLEYTVRYLFLISISDTGKIQMQMQDHGVHKLPWRVQNTSYKLFSCYHTATYSGKCLIFSFPSPKYSALLPLVKLSEYIIYFQIEYTHYF